MAINKSIKNKKKGNKRQQDVSSAPAAKKTKLLSTKVPSSPSLVVPPTRNKAPPPSSSSRSVLLPPPFPTNEKFPFPPKDFLKNVDPYKESFHKAIDTAYEGFAVDEEQSAQGKSESSLFDHDSIQQSLIKMEECGIFRTDVTQPFGLGTKCAKTYVTRCLLGDEGTTYKYLGLRMFAHPWCEITGNSTSTRGASTSNNTRNPDNNSMSLDHARGVISTMNRRLTERTKTHLDSLEQKRRERLGFNNGQPYTNGRACYDIALINRMTNSKDLKLERSVGRDKSAVSWHADSSLEHYSSIAVYQTIISDDAGANDNANHNGNHNGNHNDEAEKFRNENELASNWSVALRVANNSEGPLASRRGTNIYSAVLTDTPAISVSLPSRSAYYLLDDFNHHHQHTVLLSENGKHSRSNASAGVRYASTHRLLRDSHNVSFMLERCRSACSQFHRKGPKIWRSEQLLLSDIESDWIRQFYIQGQGHKDNLWKYWEKPMCQLMNYWGQLENRTKQVIEFLQFASMARCGMHEKKDGDKVPSRAERKNREKQKKALHAMEELMKRGSGTGTGSGSGALAGSNGDSSSVEETFYEPVCNLLEERAKMRSLWLERENDGLFHSMPAGYRPLPVPFQFGIVNSNYNSKTAEVGESPLGGAAKDLIRLSHDLKKFGKAYVSRKVSDLPKMNAPCTLKPKAQEQKESVGGDKPKVSPSSSSSTRQETKNDENKSESESESGQPHVARKESDMKQSVKEKAKTLHSDSDGQEREGRVIERPIAIAAADHQKDLNWKAWNSINIGLEMQEPWAALLTNGTKTIETRAYNIPKALVGKKIDILESKRGKEGFSSLPNVMVGEECNQAIKRIGWCIFDRVIVYRYKAKFEADEGKHLVEPESNYGWRDDTKVVYGWVVSKCGKYKQTKGKKRKQPKEIKCAIRRMRSLFEIQS